jgi:hypothetical protein
MAEFVGNVLAEFSWHPCSDGRIGRTFQKDASCPHDTSAVVSQSLTKICPKSEKNVLADHPVHYVYTNKV